jgi:hypothetical protein
MKKWGDSFNEGFDAQKYRKAENREDGALPEGGCFYGGF